MSIASELEIIARDQRGLLPADRELLRDAAKEMEAVENEAHKLRNYSLQLEQQVAAQGDRIRELEHQLSNVTPLTSGNCFVRTHTGMGPSWALMINYKLGGKVCHG